MKLTHVKIENLAAFETFETAIPTIALIQGKNGRGKSSLLECIKYGFDRGHDPDMIHGAAESGEVLLTFDIGAQVRARASRKTNETTRGWKAPGATRFTLGREQIDRITAAISYDPLDFMELDNRQQVETLLRIMPIQVAQGEIEQALGDSIQYDQVAPADPAGGANGLEIINAIHKTIYASRTDLNTSSKSLEAHAAQLQETLPAQAPDGADWAAVAKQRREELKKLDVQESELIQSDKQQFNDDKAALSKTCSDRCEEINREIDEKIKLLEAERAKRVEASIADMGQKTESLRLILERTLQDIRSANAPVRARLTTELATAEERARAEATAQGTRAAIAKATVEANAKKSRAGVLTAALERLETLKATVAARLPIKGISITDGRLVDAKGVPFRKWNTEVQYRFCLRIGVLAHGEAGFLCLDNFEHFDAEKRRMMLAACEKYAKKDGLQFILASVAETPLEITEPRREAAEGNPQ